MLQERKIAHHTRCPLVDIEKYLKVWDEDEDEE
jgi:hypothetical protein